MRGEQDHRTRHARPLHGRLTVTARDAQRIARRFLTFEDMILRFATRPDLDIFTNNEAERRSGR